MNKFIACLLFSSLTTTLVAQDLEAFTFSEDWLGKIAQKIPAPNEGTEKNQKEVLIFSLHTGFEHWTIPHTEAVMELLAKNSNSYSTTVSYDIMSFKKKQLENYDLVILNNNCSIGDHRNLFLDKLKEDETLTDKQRLKEANKLEKNLLAYVKKGGGLMVLHGAIVMQNKSVAFGEMMGGSFDYHPKQQKIQVKLVDPTHPLLTSFSADGFEHIDEPYFFNNAYFDYNFKPLLYMESDKLEGLKETVQDKINYISWIKKYGKGRIFYSSPSHNAQSFENPRLLEFFAKGMQYAAGDLSCDDTPMSVN